MTTVRAPATSANLGSGFDVFGLALAEPADVVTVSPSDETTVEVRGVGADALPTDPAENIVGIVADLLGVTAAFSIEKGVRPSSGLGSSGASAAGAVVALDRLYDLGLDTAAQIAVAAEAEGAIAGAPHADNVAAAILGGFVVVTEDGSHTLDPELNLVAALPGTTVSTATAREVLPESVPLTDHVRTVSRAATLVVGMARSDPDLVGQGMTDAVVTPRRSGLVPGFDEVTSAATAAGATGVALSGSGPAVLAVCRGDDRPAVAAAMEAAFDDAGVTSTTWRTVVGDGVRLLEG